MYPLYKDLEMLQTKHLDIYYRYNLRKVFIKIDIPEIDYHLNRDDLDKIFYEVNYLF